MYCSDGNLETGDAKCAHTWEVTAGQWWVVDLGGTYTVGSVSITNREGDTGKCIQDRARRRENDSKRHLRVKV